MDERTPLLQHEQPPPTVSVNFQPPPKYTALPPQYSPPQRVPPPVTSPPAPGTLAVNIELNAQPVCMCCPNCHRQVRTNTEHVAGICLCIVVILGILLAVLMLALLFAMILFGGVCFNCIPSGGFCKSYMDVKHTCPHCGYEIGKLKRTC